MFQSHYIIFIAVVVNVERMVILLLLKYNNLLCLRNNEHFISKWNSRPGTTTGVNSRRGDSLRYDILWWYHVNKCRAMRGNRNELAPGRKSPRCHVNTHPEEQRTFSVRHIHYSHSSHNALQARVKDYYRING